MEKQTIDFNRILDWYLNPTTHAEASSALHRLADFLQDMFEDYFNRNIVTVEIIVHEWIDELRVIDRRTYFKDDYSCKGRKIELF